MKIAILSIFYVIAGLALMINFGWIGAASTYVIGMFLGYYQMKIYDDKMDRTWLFLAPIALFLAGSIAGSIVAIPLQIVGIIDTDSWESDEEFWSKK